MRNWILLLVCIALLSLTQGAFAFPTRGSALGYDCVGCHGGPSPDSRLVLTGANGTANPTERVGATDRGALPVYTITQGASRDISFNQTNSGVNYGVSITQAFQPLGVVNAGVWTVPLDTAHTWTQRINGGNTWDYKITFSSPATFTYTVAVAPSVTPDFYEFAAQWGGDAGADAGMQRFYVQVLPAAPIPEPASLGLLALGTAGLLLRRKSSH